MRRFSQRSHLVTLSEINITPLLDLAFVLLIIFIITTPLLTQSIELKLPRGVGQPDKKLNKSDIKTVEISNTGYYKFEARQMALSEIIQQLTEESRANPNMVVYIRADKDCRYDLVAQLLDGCQKHGITRYSLRTDPTPK
jgi:biopolymer transport protein ExbD